MERNMMDANSLYPYVMRGDMPIGRGVHFEREGENFRPLPTMPKDGSNASWGSLQWLNKMQQGFINQV